MGLKQLHEDCQKVLVLFGVSGEVAHGFPREDHCALAKTVLNIDVDLQFLWAVLRGKRVVT